MSTSTVLLTEHARRYMHYAPPSFYPRDTVLARVLAMALCPSLCVCLSQVGVLSKGVKGLIWFLAWRLRSTSHTL